MNRVPVAMRAWIVLGCASMKLALGSVTLLFASRIALAQPDAGAPPPPSDPPPDVQPVEQQPIEQQPPTPPAVVAQDPPSVSPQVDPKFLPPTDPWPPPEAFDAESGAADRGFRFGSYGRVLAGADLRGGKPEAVKIVAVAPRIVEPSYLELEFSYGFETPRGLHLRPVITLAFNSTLFHDTGDFDAQPALRNMFLEAQLTKHVVGWVGSRMYRGDDIYLFDYWPLDDLNTVGGGLVFRKSESQKPGRGDAVELATQVGFNRLTEDFQFQEIDVPDPAQGATTVVQLDRQRLVASATASYVLAGEPGKLSLKGKAHGEVHAIGEGTRKRLDGTFEALPADRGYLIGGEISAFGFGRNPAYRNHLNLYLRYATGLATFDELRPPTSFGPDLKTGRASELTLGVSGNLDVRRANVLLGILSRRFVDPDTTSADFDDGWEYALDIRPLVRVVRELSAGVDLSYQARFPRGLNPNTVRAEDPAVFQIAPMLVFSPMGPSSYDRPQLRLVYRAAHLNQAALDLYVPDDDRHDNPWVHFLGFQAEWWFNSSTYR